MEGDRPARKRARKGSKQVRRGALGGWVVRWTDHDGARYQRGGFDTRDAADAFLAARQLERNRMRLAGELPVRPMTLSGATETILDRLSPRAEHGRQGGRRISKLTVKAYRRLLGILAGVLGDVPMHSVTRPQMQSAFAILGRKYSPNTLAALAGAAATAWREAIEIGFARENPAKGLRLPRREGRVPPYLSSERLEEILAATPEQLRDQVAVLMDTGMRREELFVRLHWRDVDPEFRSLKVHGKGGKERMVPLTRRAAEVLRRRAKAAGTVDREARVFPRPHHRDATEAFRAAMLGARIRGVTFHTLRHAFASGLARAGVPIPDIARLLGHADVKTTMIYAVHAPADAGTRAIEALERARHRTT